MIPTHRRPKTKTQSKPVHPEGEVQTTQKEPVDQTAMEIKGVNRQVADEMAVCNPDDREASEDAVNKHAQFLNLHKELYKHNLDAGKPAWEALIEDNL